MLAILMVLSAVGCGNTSAPENNNTESDVTTSEPAEETTTTDAVIEGATTEAPTTDAATTDAETTEGVTTETDPVTDEVRVFKTGYSRVVITPPKDVYEAHGYTKVSDDIYATCLAVNDGETTAIFISLDLQDLMEYGNDKIRERVVQVTGVPKDNIFIAVTHDHSAQLWFEAGVSTAWAYTTFASIATAAQEAIDDLSDSDMYIGTGSTPGAAWVRRYIMPDGTMRSVEPGPAPGALGCVSEADDSLQVVRFVREDKKDIVLTNWQGHFAHAITMEGKTTSVSADITHYLRKEIEKKDTDTLVIFFAGASGNLNLNPPNESVRRYDNYIEVARAIVKETVKVMRDMQKINVGTINITKQVYKAENAHDSADAVAAAQSRLDAGGTLPADRYMVARNKESHTDLRLSAISIGELAFVTAPYEMFDTNGVTIKEESPFKMTIVITNSDGAYAYIPSYEAFTVYGGYETETTYFAAGMGEELVAEYLKMLTALSESN